MPFPPATRKLVLAVHLTVSIGWLGALAGYLALDLATATSTSGATLRSAYVGMDLIATRVIVPLAIASLVTGVAISLGTKWGLFRHYWVLISLVLTVLAAGVLLVETETIRAFARIARDEGTTTAQLDGLGNTLVHSIGGMIVLLVILILNIYKPRGMTRYGWRIRHEEPQT